ncbi:MAG TPA: PAS domain-containing protein, partial [Ideonella sp.]|nr:PAS domain-containing protein [Ideonella sp.]
MKPGSAIDSLAAQRWPRRTIVSLGATFIAAIVALAAHDIQRGYQYTIDDTQRELQTLARWIAGATARELQAGMPLPLERLQQSWSDLQLDNGTTIALRRTDGATLASWPAATRALGGNDAEHFAAEEALTGWPLAVVVTRERTPALAPWRSQAQRTVLTTLGLALLASALLALVTRQFRRLARAHRSLAASRERFALAAAGSDDGIWDWEMASDRVYLSLRARELYGTALEVESMPREEWFATFHVHPDDAARRKAAIDAHLAGASAAYVCEYRVRDPVDGRWRWLRARGLCVRDAAGRATRMAGSVSDIDARQRAEEALRQSEQRYALAMTGSNEGHWVWDVVSDQFYASPIINQIYGLPANAQLTSSSAHFAQLPIHPDDRERLASFRAECLAGSSSHFELEYRIVVPSTGEVRWLAARGQCFRDAEGRPERFAGSVVDVTKKKRMQEALRESEERFTLAVAGSKDGIVDWDIANDRMFTSERARRIVGIESGREVASCSDWMALVQVHPDDAARETEDFRRLLEGDADIQEGEYRFRQSDGSYHWVRIRGIAVRDANGRALRWAGSVSDIDAHKQAEAALRRSEERYQLAVAGANQGLWDWDLESDTLFLSARAQAFMGLEPGEPLRPRREWIELSPFHPDDRAEVRRVISAHLRGETAHSSVEYRLRHLSGQW